MRILIRIIAVLAAISAISSLWAAISFVGQGLLVPLIQASWLGSLTVLGWVIAVIIGPFAAVQLWRCRESGRLAGIVLFGAGVVLYLASWLTSAPGESVGENLTRALVFSWPAVVLLMPKVRKVCQANEPAR